MTLLVRAIAVALAANASVLIGCAAGPPPEVHGRYVDLPRQLDAPAALAAAESTLRARGYTIETNEQTGDQGRIVARPGGSASQGLRQGRDRLDPGVTVRAQTASDGVVRLVVTQWPRQDGDPVANTLLVATLRTMGLQPPQTSAATQ